jgi:ubiquitin carboxyl-terminal hydrolase 34
VGDDVVFCRLRDWMIKMMKYADGSRRLYEHFTNHREFWLAFPEIFWGLNQRRQVSSCSSPGTLIDTVFSNSRFFGNFLQRNQPARRALSEMFHQLARLVGRFVAMDVMTLTYHSQKAGIEQEPDLGSRHMLEILAWLFFRKDDQQHIGRNLDAHYHWSWDSELSKMTQYFQDEGGAIPRLTRFVRGHLFLLDKYPKLVENLAVPTRFVGKFVVEEAYILENSPLRQYAESARQQITEGYDYFTVMADGLENIIDKHVNCLHHEAATVHIANLTEIFQKALTHEDTSTRALIEKRHKEEPQISRKLMPMVLAYEWRFTVLKSLITSSQMQLRVVGATTMCNDLLKLYNQNKVGEPSRNPTLVFLANFVLHHKLIDYLVSIGSHPEIINESHNILGFLIVTKTYPAELTDRIWNTITTSQDPRVVEAILRMIQQCSNLYEYSALLYFCEKLNGLPLASFNASMREFCGIMFQQLVSKASLESHPFVDAPPYILCVRLIRESSILTPQAPNGYPDIQNFAATRFLELLGGGPDTKNRSDIYEGCIEDISLKAPTAPGSICVLHALIQQNADDLASLTKEYGLTQLLVEELELRHNETQSSLFRNSPVNVARRGIICEIISRQADTITPDLGRRLWNHLVGIDSTTDLERAYSWAILNKTNKAHPRNSYIRTCFEEHLPNLPPQCFTDGALEFCRSAVTSWLASIKNKHIDDGFSFDSAGLEQLWRMILFAPSHTIDAKAISIIVEVYLESQFVKSLPRADAKGIHLALVKRCLKQLAAAASRLKTFSDGVSSGEEDGMVIVPSETQFIEQEQIFARSLAVLREFLKAYQAKPQFAAAKPRPFVPVKPSVAQGEPLTVKYQSFDGNVSTEVKELHLGKLNTTAALLASLQQATGFQNYSIYLAGQPFMPDETTLSKSLDDLRLTSLVLVKRQDGSLMSPGNHEASLEMEIMKHFEELWGYLGMQEKVAKEVIHPQSHTEVRANQTPRSTPF